MPDPSPNESRPGWFVAWVLAPLYEFWNRLRGWLLVLKPCRASLLLVAAALAFFLGAPQGEDVVRALAERQSGHQDEWQRFLFFMGVLAWTLSAWYWARVMMQFRFPGVPARDARLQGFRVWVPRLIGTAAPLGVAASLYLASRGYDLEEHGDVNRLLRIYAVLCALGAAAFLVTVSLRRTIARFAYERVKGLAATRAGAPLTTLLAVPRSAEEVYGELEFRDLAGPTRLMLGFAVLVAIVLFCLFTFFVQWSAPLFGTAGILLFAAAGWIAAGSVLDFIGMRLRYPAFLTLLALTMLFSLWNDNHEVRTLAEPQAANREDVRAAFREWMKRQPERAASYPMVFVDAEGGGIRAAYWAATVLGRIQDDNPCFAERLFSLSGVSGGSLGASVFLALFVERRGATSADCRAGAPGRPSIMESAQQILGEDFLAPVSAALLYPDLAQRFIPVPVRALDRATALEQSWERAWREHTGTNRFAEPFDALWADRSRWTPALFLNATWVETGKRLIVSNLRVSAPPEEAVFVDGEDAQAFFAPRSLALSTAAHMSARFTYVSPAGTLQRDGVPRGRVVDGGYFENSGATTTLEIVKLLPSMEEEDPRWAKVEPYVIHISNEPVNPGAPPDSLESTRKRRAIRPQPWLNESLSPLWAMLNTRDARGVYARDTLAWHVGEDHFLKFGLCRSSGNIPLGWVLSASTQKLMDAQLTEKKCASRRDPGKVVFDNPRNLERIRELLK
jgi:hypothetical protein